ncbi:MAG: tetratricopeptide repeat protein [Bacteroidales bacterium]
MAALFSLIYAQNVRGQRSLIFDNEDLSFNRAMDLFEKEKYGAAQKHFLKAIEEYEDVNTLLKSEAEYYSALCAIELFNDDAEYLMIKFIDNNPESIRLNDANFHLGRFYYRKRNYRKSGDWLEAARHEYLREELRDEYFFMLGYGYFMRNEFERASRALFVIKDWDSPYAAPATYYYSHIAYTDNNLATALPGFLSLREDESFSGLVPYYIIQIYYKQRRYDDVIANGPELLEVAVSRRVHEIARIIGESYYRRRQYKDAIYYLEIFMDNTGRISREDRYQLGYCYYQTQRYEEAAAMFEKVGDRDDLLSQNTNYHLADCYINTGDKQKARMAFSVASSADYDKTIQEDALFNYSVLTFEIAYSPFNEAIKGFNSFIELFPDSRRIDEAYNYLVMAYMNTRNYREALISIDNIRIKNNDIRRAHQRVAYFRGLELYSNLRFEDAIEIFDESLQNAQFNPAIAAQAYYWKGEAQFRLGRYDDAVRNYNRFLLSPGAFELNEYNIAHYNMGYAYFKNNNYQNAVSWFRRYLNLTREPKTRMAGDAMNRIGDSYFIMSQYETAIDYYDRSISNGMANQDYALFQKAVALGLMNRINNKIEVLDRLLENHPDSPYRTDALYEMGNSYMTVNSPLRAITYYRKLVEDHPSSTYVSSALLQLGLIDYNRNRNEEAIAYYKKVAEGYPGTPESRSALAGLRNIYLDMNEVESYVDYTRTLGDYARVSISEQDSLTYIAAENLYMAGNCRQAVENFGQYIDQFRNGSFILNAHFYKADCHHRMNEFNEALESYNFIIGMFRNTFTEQALAGASSINFELGNYEDALSNYEELERVAELGTNLLVARIGQMRCNVILEDHQGTIDAASRLLATDNLAEEIIREVHFSKGKAHMAMKQFDQALNEFRLVANEVTSREGAESKYRIAEIYFLQGEYEKSEQEIYDIVAMNTPHQYWMARSFILLADIYLELGDDFQARHTLQSIIDNYDITDDGILTEARNRIRDIEKEEDMSLPDDRDTLEIMIRDR